MKLERANPQQVREVALKMRDSDYREFSATSFAETREALAAELETRYGGRLDVYCASLDENAVAIGAFLEIRPNVLTLLFFATDDFRRIIVPLTRFIRQRFSPRLKAAGAHRIECVSIDGHDDAHRRHHARRAQREGRDVHPRHGDRERHAGRDRSRDDTEKDSAKEN